MLNLLNLISAMLGLINNKKNVKIEIKSRDIDDINRRGLIFVIYRYILTLGHTIEINRIWDKKS